MVYFGEKNGKFDKSERKRTDHPSFIDEKEITAETRRPGFGEDRGQYRCFDPAGDD